MKRSLSVLLPLVMLATPFSLRADVTLPSVIGSHMVLQRELPIKIWGWADQGEEVTVTLGDAKASAKPNTLGKWMVELPALKSGGAPLDMTIAGKNTIKLTDILVGEVWVGSGQSNMQWSVTQSDKPQEEISAATYPKIRLFLVPLVPSGTPANDVNASWTDCTPATVPNFSAVLYFFGRQLHKELDVPVGLIATSWGGTRIEPWIPPVGFASEKDLKTELGVVETTRANYQKLMKSNLAAFKPWLAAAEAAVAAGQDIPDAPSMPAHPFNSSGAHTGLYNGMIHPLVPFGIRGAIWYQGESNRGQGMKYYTLMRGLVQGWREVWGEGEFPFLFVQLAPYHYDNKPTQLAEIWEAQTAALAIPNTGMAVTTDIGNVKDIHPKNKQEVGRRLALWALAKTYGKKELVYSGPLFDKMEVDVDRIKLTFKHAEGGLKSRDGKALTWFTVAGEDRKFYPATATIEGNAVLVESSKVSNPIAVRFGWDQDAEPNLANKEGLPASPFRTDTWDGSLPAFPEK